MQDDAIIRIKRKCPGKNYVATSLCVQSDLVAPELRKSLTPMSTSVGGQNASNTFMCSKEHAMDSNPGEVFTTGRREVSNGRDINDL
jgi:hypothetical protein